jgi:hypothetical protein
MTKNLQCVETWVTSHTLSRSKSVFVYVRGLSLVRQTPSLVPMYNGYLRSDCRKQSLSLDSPRCRDFPVPISRGRTVIFDIVEYIIMEWTIPNEIRIFRICRRVCILKKRRGVLLTSFPQTSTGYDFGNPGGGGGGKSS